MVNATMFTENSLKTHRAFIRHTCEYGIAVIVRPDVSLISGEHSTGW